MDGNAARGSADAEVQPASAFRHPAAQTRRIPLITTRMIRSCQRLVDRVIRHFPRRTIRSLAAGVRVAVWFRSRHTRGNSILIVQAKKRETDQGSHEICDLERLTDIQDSRYGRP